MKTANGRDYSRSAQQQPDAADPSKVEQFQTGFSGSGLASTARGTSGLTIWQLLGKATVERMLAAAKAGENYAAVLAHAMAKQQGDPNGGSVTLLRPDGTEYPGSPFAGGGLPSP